MEADSFRLLILSDTHGSLPDAVLRACEGAAHIVHAGDVGSEEFLHELGSIAPVTAVLGNVDPPGRAPLRARIALGGWRILIQHIVWARGGPSGEVRDLLAAEPADLVIFGHSHEPFCDRGGDGGAGDAVFFNPGSCGPKRFSLPKTYGEALLGRNGGRFRVFDLEGDPSDPPIIDREFSIGGVDLARG